MDLKFEERPYAGNSFRPQPEIHLDPQTQLLIVATPWGARSAATKVIGRMTDYLSLARTDNEATSPFERLSCLSTQANNLRVAALLANEVLYREDNQTEYKSGVELFAALVDEGELVWLQAGNPQILLSRKGRTLLPLGSQIDLSYDLSEGAELLPALPAQLLGLDVSLNLNINSFRARVGDQLVLLSHSQMPDFLFTQNLGVTTGASDSQENKPLSLEPLSRALARACPNLAFWLGILSVGGESQNDPASDSIKEAE
jgi:hypothetical protein